MDSNEGKTEDKRKMKQIYSLANAGEEDMAERSSLENTARGEKWPAEEASFPANFLRERPALSQFVSD